MSEGPPTGRPLADGQTLAPPAELATPAAAEPSGSSPTHALGRFVTWNVLGIGASLAIGFVTSVLLGRLLGPSGRGVLAVMLASGTVVLALTAGGLPVSVVFFAAKRADRGPAILGNCLLHTLVLAAVLIPLTALFFPSVAAALAHGHGGRTWILAATLIPVTFLDWTTHSQLQGQLAFGRYNVLLVVQRLVYACGILIMLGVLSLGVGSALLATMTGSAVMIVGAALPILRLGRPRLDFALMREMLGYGARAQVGSVLQIANGRLDVIILGLFRPPSQVGYYVVAQAVAELVVQLADAFQWSNMALVSRDAHAATSAVALRHLTLISGVAALLDAGFGTLIILFAYGPAFHPAVLPMLILLPGVWMMAIAVVVQGDLGGRGRPGLASTLVAISAAVTVVLDLALIPPFGVVGAAIASVCAYATLGISSLVTLSRISGIAFRQLCVPSLTDLEAYVIAARRLLARRRAGEHPA